MNKRIALSLFCSRPCWPWPAARSSADPAFPRISRPPPPSARPAATSIPRLEACTVVMVGKHASTDGSVMTTHTCDCGTLRLDLPPHPGRRPQARRRAQDLPHRPVRRHESRPRPEVGPRRRQLHRPGPPQPAHTYGYIHGDFGYMNDKQVSIGESTLGQRGQDREHDRRPQVRHHHADPPGHGARRHRPRGHPGHGLAGREIRLRVHRLGRDAGRGRPQGGLAVRDHAGRRRCGRPQSGKPGAVWCAQRIPDDHVAVCPNESRIGEIDLTNKDYVHGLAQRRLLRRRAEALRPEERQALQLEAGLLAQRDQRPGLGRLARPDVAVLQPGRALAQPRPRDAQHGLPRLGQAGQEAVPQGRHRHRPRPLRGDDLRSRPAACRAAPSAIPTSCPTASPSTARSTTPRASSASTGPSTSP